MINLIFFSFAIGVVALGLWFCWKDLSVLFATAIMANREQYTLAEVAAAEELLNQEFDVYLKRLQLELEIICQDRAECGRISRDIPVDLCRTVQEWLENPGQVPDQARRDQANYLMAGIFYEHGDFDGADWCLLKVHNRELEGYRGLLQRLNLRAHARRASTMESS